ncbi:MAG: hypothetical protein ACK42L_05380 [Thermoanaerobaculum sp.]
MSRSLFHRDFLDLFRAFCKHQVEFLVVGAYAMAAHGVPRATGDLDVWVKPTLENAKKVYRALAEFGAPLDEHKLRPEDFSKSGTVYQIGLPPRRIDILTAISGASFEQAWPRRLEVNIGGLTVPFLGKLDLIRNKKATGREKDLLDAKILQEQPN